MRRSPVPEVYRVAPELEDHPDIKKLVDFITQGRGAPEGPRAELEARLALLVASELNRATHSITNNLIELATKVGGLGNSIDEVGTAALRRMKDLTDTIDNGAKALNKTSEAGNRLNRLIGWLTGVGVFVAVATLVLAAVQVATIVKGH
jgi:hypothetical protein